MGAVSSTCLVQSTSSNIMTSDNIVHCHIRTSLSDFVRQFLFVFLHDWRNVLQSENSSKIYISTRGDGGVSFDDPQFICMPTILMAFSRTHCSPNYRQDGCL